jgi:hypothetical protein
METVFEVHMYDTRNFLCMRTGSMCFYDSFEIFQNYVTIIYRYRACYYYFFFF